MPFIEQLIFGVNLKENPTERTILAQSPGMGQETSAEIVRLCENWGTAPPLGLEQPALMSFRLESTMPAVAGRMYVVIRAGRGLNPLFHAVVLSEGSYAPFFRNPFALARAVTFRDEWNPDLKLQREEIAFDPSVALVDPPANKDDIGLVDEAVLKFIAEGKLSLPIEQANAQSDRCLALVIACLPEKERKELRFASFAPSEANNFNLMGQQSEGCLFAGWKRMMMAWLAGEYVEEVENYIEEVRKYLEAGDQAGIARTSQRHNFRAGPGPESLDAPRRGTVSAAMPVQGSAPPRPVKPLQAAPAKAAMPSSGRPKAPQGPAAKPPQRSAIKPQKRPAVKPLTASPAAGPVRESRWESRPKPRKLSPLKRKKSVASGGSRSVFGGKFVRVALVALLLALVGTAAMMWKEGKTLAESLEWANLQSLMGERPRTERAATLLEVVDVGGVYARQMKIVAGSGKGLNQSVDKGRRKALGNLRTEAAGPLNQQVELFAKLATDGIQQGNRPDRERQRMRSLANQGLVLENELARLELAWFSLAASVFWDDLSTLSDEAVSARRDSLARAEKGVLEDARTDLGTIEAKMVLDQTRGHVEGMASLLTLFGAKTWSQTWEKNLARAAGKVSPAASRMTRAYANSAFALIRLKKAERRGDQASLPFLRELKDQDWPSAEIRSILPSLRAQTAMFANGRAPALLTSTLDLYAALKRPASLAAEAAESPRVLADLTANRAYQFDPAAYRDFLERVRFEAALLRLDGQDDPALIPDHLYAGGERDLVVAFGDTMSIHHTPAAWDSMAVSLGTPFMNRWAEYLGSLARSDLEKNRQQFDAAWIECRDSVAKLREEVAAGRDWTRTWLAVNEQTQDILGTHARVLAQDPERAAKLADIANLGMSLKATLPLGLQAGTIRLDQDRLADSIKAVLEIRVVPDGKAWRSEKFYIGPASPEGMGWVGTVSLEHSLEIQPRLGLEVRIISEKNEEILLTVTCPPLAEGVGPGGMARPRSGDTGAVSLKIAPDYWKSLRVPDLGPVF
jgi:hypothetical protein